MSILNLPNTIDDELFTFFSNGDLYRYSRTSTEFFERVKSYINRAFKYRRFLSKFFTSFEQDSFLRLQRQTGLIICGESLLQFLMRSKDEPQTLEIIIHVQHVQPLSEWLNESRFHTLVQDESVDDQLLRFRYPHRPPVGEAWSSLADSYDNGPVTKVVVVSDFTSKKMIIHVTSGAVLQMIINTPASKWLYSFKKQ